MSIQQEQKNLQRSKSEMGHKIKELHRLEEMSAEEKEETINDKIRFENNLLNQ